MSIRSLVIGGAGFIGSTLCRALLNKGHNVICIDNLSTGNIDNIKGIKSKNFVFRQMDVLDIGVHNITANLDYIYHLACPASPVKYQKDAIHTLNICFNGTQNVLELARETKARLIFTSTSEVYGDPLESPQKETYLGNVNCTGPRACYDEGKRVAESLIINYGKQYGINYGIARVFNTYGPYMSITDGRVISTFLEQARTGAPLTIYGTGKQTRSFCYVTDLVDGLILLAESMEHGPINLGNPEEITILELCNMISDITHNATAPIFLDKPEDDPCRRCPDITLAKERLKWSPTIDLRTGVTKLIKLSGSG